MLCEAKSKTIFLTRRIFINHGIFIIIHHIESTVH